MFSFCGIVNDITLITDKDTHVPKGYGFVAMMDEGGAERAIRALDGLIIEGRTLSVRFAAEKRLSVRVWELYFDPAGNFNENSDAKSGEIPKNPKRIRRRL